MNASRRHARTSVFARSAVFIFAVAQLCIALVSATEGRFGADARSHVEAAGTSIHHAHDEAACAACTARALLVAPKGESTHSFESLGAAAVVASQLEIKIGFAGRISARPRAPPVRLA